MGKLYCIVPEDHELAQRKRVTAAEISKYPLIGIDPEDPYGRIMAGIFAQAFAALQRHDPRAFRHHRVRAGEAWARHRGAR